MRLMQSICTYRSQARDLAANDPLLERSLEHWRNASQTATRKHFRETSRALFRCRKAARTLEARKSSVEEREAARLRGSKLLAELVRNQHDLNVLEEKSKMAGDSSAMTAVRSRCTFVLGTHERERACSQQLENARRIQRDLEEKLKVPLGANPELRIKVRPGRVCAAPTHLF
jgi:hypothetical protein